MKTTLRQAIPYLRGHRILVIGDLILDEYLTGTAVRLSREAPIPVLEFESARTIPGGAANPAMNIAALGSQATQVGLIGQDEAGKTLRSQLQQAGIDISGIVVDTSRCTTCKTRLMSQGSLRFPQQVARLDRINRQPPASQVEAEIIRKIEIAIGQSEAIIVSDYHNGLLTPAIVVATRQAAQQHGCLLIVDSQGNLETYRGYDIIRANQSDTEHYLNHRLHREADFATAATQLLKVLQAQGVIIGRGAEGVSLQGQTVPYHHFPPANVTEVYDVTGAGDTAIAVLALGLVVGLTLAEAACLTNYAAGLVVQKLGNATPTQAELLAAIENWHTA